MQLIGHLQIAGAAAVAIFIGVVPSRLPGLSQELGLVIRGAQFIPVAFAGFFHGLRGGLLVGIIAALALLPQPAVILTVEALLLCSTGGLIGFLSDRERRQKISLQKTARELTGAHEELQKNFEGMKRAERLFALGQLSAGLAHEIRNPLASISGAVGVMRRYPEARDKRDECFSIIEKECHRLNRLLTNFIDFARPRTPQFQTVNISEVIDAVVALANHAIGRQPISVRKIIVTEPPPLECDPEQLQQVLLNLTINAIQASGEGGEVVLETALLNQSRLVIKVRDQGSGVEPEHIDRLFDPFFTTKESGSGLGLPVAHEIVRQLGGVLAATRNPDRGMTFSITIPLARKGTHESKANPGS